MRFGMCTDLATTTRDRVEYSLLERIKAAGFDFVEFPLMMIDTLSDEDFEILLTELERIGLACDCSCNYFPGRIRVTGPSANKKEIDGYLDHAMGRAARMGVRKIVFGSNNSRNLPEGEPMEQGYDELCGMILDSVIPYCRKYGITVVMEPIRRQSCNFVITLKEGKYVCDRVNKPEIMLMADLMHMNYNGEDPRDIVACYPYLRHVHVCNWDRALPENGFDEHLQTCLDVLKSLGYDRTISFESRDGTSPESLSKALALLKKQFEK